MLRSTSPTWNGAPTKRRSRWSLHDDAGLSGEPTRTLFLIDAQQPDSDVAPLERSGEGCNVEAPSHEPVALLSFGRACRAVPILAVPADEGQELPGLGPSGVLAGGAPGADLGVAVRTRTGGSHQVELRQPWRLVEGPPMRLIRQVEHLPLRHRTGRPGLAGEEDLEPLALEAEQVDDGPVLGIEEEPQPVPGGELDVALDVEDLARSPSRRHRPAKAYLPRVGRLRTARRSRGHRDG